MNLRLARRTNRRDWLRATGLGLGAFSASGWMETLSRLAAAETSAPGRKKRSCILLWMAGGPSQIETFDPKLNHENGAGVKPISTSATGIQISEYLPKLATVADDLTIIRSMKTNEGDHARASYHLRTGYKQNPALEYPTLGSILSRELGSETSAIPDFVSIAPNRDLNRGAFGPGFLGPKYAPFVVEANGGIARVQQQNESEDDQEQTPNLRVSNIDRPDDISNQQADARLEILSGLNDEFLKARPDRILNSYRSSYDRALRLMNSEARKAFDLDAEPDEIKEAYGRNEFGMGCLMARRLVEQGVSFVEVSLNGVRGDDFATWDSHGNHLDNIQQLCRVLDPAYAALIGDLKQRGLLESTLVIWMGEFGRTPKINDNDGRDHFPAAWSTVLAGAGVQGGQVVGKTSADGMEVTDRPVSVGDLMSTVCQAMQLDPTKQNMSNIGRPIRLADPEGQAISGILTDANG